MSSLTFRLPITLLALSLFTDAQQPLKLPDAKAPPPFLVLCHLAKPETPRRQGPRRCFQIFLLALSGRRSTFSSLRDGTACNRTSI